MKNMQKFNESLSNLDNLGIFQLRELAREIGVHLPTTLRKQDLIKKIKEIASGESYPVFVNTKKGRPPKQYQTFKQDNTSGKEYDYLNWGKNIVPYAQSPISIYKMSDNLTFVLDERKYTNISQFSGIVSIDEQGNARIHEGELCEIGERRIARVEAPVIKKFDLRDGDRVVGRVGENIRGESGLSLFDVTEINGKEPGFSRANFAEEKAMPAVDLIKTQIPITKYISPLAKGQRVLVYSKDRYVPKQFMHELASEIAKVQKVIYLTLDEQPENYYNPTNSNMEFILCPFDLSVDRQLYILEIALNRAKRLAEQGEDVVVLIEDLYTAAKLYSRCYKLNGLSDSGNVYDCVKKVLASGRKLFEAGSITLVCGLTNNDDASSFEDLIYEVKKACNSFITFNSGLYYGVYDFNLEESFSLNQERLLDAQTLKNSFEIRKQAVNKSASEIEKLLDK